MRSCHGGAASGFETKNQLFFKKYDSVTQKCVAGETTDQKEIKTPKNKVCPPANPHTHTYLYLVVMIPEPFVWKT